MKKNDMLNDFGLVPIQNPKIINKSHNYFVKAAGNSMTPHICDGDLVLINTSVKVKAGDIVAVSLNGDILIKVFAPTKHGVLYLSSFNMEYESIRIYEDEDELIVIGKAVKVIKDLNYCPKFKQYRDNKFN